MKETAAKLNYFFNGFGIPAYSSNDVPDEVELPYITFKITEPNWDAQANIFCQVWYPKGPMEEMLAKADEIVSAVGTGIKIDMPGGHIVLYPDNNETQTLSDSVSQSVYITLLINVYHKPGV